MIAVQRTFLVQKSPDVVNYLKDFSRAQDWDPGTKTCTREDAGPIAEGVDLAQRVCPARS